MNTHENSSLSAAFFYVEQIHTQPRYLPPFRTTHMSHQVSRLVVWSSNLFIHRCFVFVFA